METYPDEPRTRGTDVEVRHGMTQRAAVIIEEIYAGKESAMAKRDCVCVLLYLLEKPTDERGVFTVTRREVEEATFCKYYAISDAFRWLELRGHIVSAGEAERGAYRYCFSWNAHRR